MQNFNIHNGSCLDVVPNLPPSACIFADPFDNLGLKYNQYKDKMPDDKYVAFLEQCLYTFASNAPVLWMSFYAKWTVDMGAIAKLFLQRLPDWEVKTNVQVFTFGQHNHHDFGNNHRPLWRFKHKNAPLYPDQARVPSWRQRNGDKRADPRGRVPGDVLDFQYPADTDPIDWHLIYPHLDCNTRHEAYLELQRAEARYGEELPGDVFDFPRVTGNSKQRCDWHPTQLHEDMIERCLKLTTKEGDLVTDAFGGTGTTLRVCKRINRSCTLVELDSDYCAKIAEENGLTKQILGHELSAIPRWAA